jgi:oxalate decarboxylase/phosphoglucose isomerase-like protein (cupin superfamily)
MMKEPHIVNLEQVEWKPHPTIPKVLTRVFENAASHPLADAFLGQVIGGGEIPWHVHEQASETAYVIQGHGVLLYALPENRDHPSQAEIKMGVALTVPPGWWHSVLNPGETPLILFAFHTPSTF